MSSKLHFGFFVVLGLAVRLAAQSQPGAQLPTYLPASEPDVNKLMADRQKFVKEYYQPDEATLAKLQKSMLDVVPFQEKYQKDSALTLSRISLAMGIVSEPGTTEEERAARLNKFGQQAGTIYSRAPLSLANVVKMTEPLLTQDKVAFARAKISGQLSSRLQGQPLDMTKLDVYLTPPPSVTPRPIISRSTNADQREMLSNHRPETPLTNTAPPQPPAQPVENKVKPQTPQPVQPPAPTAAQPVAPPPPPPKVVKVALPKDTWSKDIESSKKKYNYNPEQLKVVEIITTSVMSRAEKPSTEKDISGNMPIDLLYDELVQRLDALASIEQRQKANPPGATPATPAAPVQPAGH
jgi:hypothetical protein